MIRPRFFSREALARIRHGLYVLPLVILGLAHASLHTALWSSAGVGAFALAAYALTARFLGRSSLAIADGTIRRTSWLRRPSTCPRSAVARVVELPLVLTRLGVEYPERWLLFIDENGEVLMRAYAGYYPPEELARFSAGLGLPWERVGRAVTAAQARRALPHAFPWPWAHLVLTFLSLLIVAFFVLVVVEAILMAVG